MNDQTTKKIEQLQTLGNIYAFIHERAKFVRQQKAAGDSVHEADSPAAVSTSGRSRAQEEYIRNGS